MKTETDPEDLDAILQKKLRRNTFKIRAPLTEDEIQVYDAAISQFEQGRTYSMTQSPSLRTSLQVEYGMFTVGVYQKLRDNKKKEYLSSLNMGSP